MIWKKKSTILWIWHDRLLIKVLITWQAYHFLLHLEWTLIGLWIENILWSWYEEGAQIWNISWCCVLHGHITFNGVNLFMRHHLINNNILSTTRILKKNPFIKKKSFQNGFTPFSSFIFLIEAVFFIDFRCQSMTIDQYFITAPIPNVSKYTTALFTWCSKSLYIHN